ncbi:MAG TPA: SH3 domain-containing protein [Leptospiraceae bacterium]|nr:SH3 domain-containing protein [Leptospiraceae bacterium]HMY69417.1 SH3 domain-containing protein [Leptospiraceae bacterium]HNF16823.1 SH3 domain-containing protein [Leptospiraceae bacterium]HNF27880.1 SH3 domain-containing protein [Leptospiraceae bacterium]HNH08198.1 SH3 domain-containing protein [Leptospiraceae bacterium]
MRIWKTFLFTSICFALPVYTQSSKLEENSHLPKSGQTWYAASPKGLNLRSEASDKSEIIAKLPNRAEIKIEKQPGSLVPAEIKFLNVSADENKKSGEMILKGYWVYVTFGTKSGYVFSRFMIPFPPIHKKEYRMGYDISPYLERIFSLDRPLLKKVQMKDGDAKYLKNIYKYTERKGIRLTVEQSENDYGWGNAELFLPGWSLEQAVVFFYSVLIPLEKDPVLNSYSEGQSAEYSLDPIPNTIEFKKEKKGVLVKWHWGAD